MDYVNKYPSVLQRTSYNFTETATTGEMCAGVKTSLIVSQVTSSVTHLPSRVDWGGLTENAEYQLLILHHAYDECD